MQTGRKCAIYSRVSTKDQDPSAQLHDLRSFAEMQGWDVVYEYIDVESGQTGEREQLKKMLLAASQRQFDILLFWSLDRLTREGAYRTLYYLEHLNHWGVDWRSFSQPQLDTTNPDRVALIAWTAEVAKQEIAMISERTKAGIRRARSEGKTLGRPRVNASSEEVRALRAEGLSWARISKKLGIARSTAQSYAQQGNQAQPAAAA